MFLLRLMSIISWTFLQLDPGAKDKPSFEDLLEQLRHPEEEPFS
jgi:hypothetical protein